MKTQEKPNIPNEWSFSAMVYGVNVFLMTVVLSSIIILLVVFSYDMQDSLMGMLMLVPVWTVITLAIVQPSHFYYMWGGWWNILKMFWAFTFIPALLVLFQLKDDQKVCIYPLVLMSIVIMYVIPNIVIPLMVVIQDALYGGIASILRIDTSKPNYIMRDIVMPSISISSMAVLVTTLIANKVIQ